MNKKDEALKLAQATLEAIATHCDMACVVTPDGAFYLQPAITALREALAEQPKGRPVESVYASQVAYTRALEAYCDGLAEQEPVAYAVYHRMRGGKSLHWPEQHSPDGDANEYQLVPLYTSPPAQLTWVGLTEQERGKVYADWRWSDGRTSNLALCEAIEAKLKERNT